MPTSPPRPWRPSPWRTARALEVITLSNNHITMINDSSNINT